MKEAPCAGLQNRKQTKPVKRKAQLSGKISHIKILFDYSRIFRRPDNFIGRKPGKAYKITTALITSLLIR
jgi:hypothetical protein